MKKTIAFLASAIVVSVLVWIWTTAVPIQSEATEPLPQAQVPATALGKPALDQISTVANATEVSDSPLSETTDPMTAFRDWTQTYLKSPQTLRATLLPEGEVLAKQHTQELAAMIRLDPQQAIASAVPMVVRQDLPGSIVSLLEKRVRMKAALEVYGNVPLPGQEAAPDFKPYTRSVTKEDGSYWNAYVYGKRSSQRTISTASLNGISIGNDMAVADSPVRQLETGERPDPSGREVVETCPVSEKETIVDRTAAGELPAVTEETPAFETAERIVYVCSGGHIEQVVEKLSAEEERQHWESQGAYLNAGAGSGAPLDPIGTIPGSTTTGQRSILYIRATFPDHRIDPQSEAECQDSLRQMADFITQTSFGRCYFTYAVAPLIVLPYPESWYVQHQTDGSSADTVIQNQARTIARELGYDYLQYDYDAVRWNGSVGSYGGSASVGGRGMRLKTNSVGTFCHELGHNLGVWHANFWRTTPPSLIGPGNNQEYGNSFDLMGSSGGMGQFTAHFKNILSWLPNETHWTVNSPGTYRIYQFDSSFADPSYRYALRIKKDAEREYWAEFRQRLTTNTGFMNGLMMTWDGWGQGGIGGSGGSPANGSNRGAQLLDMTPGSFGNGITDTRNDSALWVGRTFSDTDTGIHITPITKNTTTVPPSMDVYVSMGDTPGNLAPTLALSTSSATAATNVAITLTAAATDPNGDPLAYAWVFNDGTYSTNNSSVQTKSWSTAGHYQVLCTASDRKGKRTTRAILITVGSPTTFHVSGTISGPDSLPLEGVYVANYAPSNNTSHPNSSTFRGTWTDSDGNYTLTGLTAAAYTITPTLYPNVFTASGFTNPVTAGPNSIAKNFTSALLPTVTITITDPIANEGAAPGTGTIRLERSGSTTNALAVQIFNANTGTATRNTDYSLNPTTTASTNDGGNGTSQYNIPAGASFLDITVTPINDSTIEGTEYANLNFANTSGGYILAGAAIANVEIVDDENANLPVVKLTQLDNVASETNPDIATLKLERNGSTAASLTVNLTRAGTATSVTDYAGPSSVVIPAGSASATFTLTPVDDTIQEGTETAIITITTHSAYARDALSNSQTVMLYDNDLPTLTVTATDATLTEAPGNSGTFTISRSGGNPYLPLTVDYALAGRAVHGVDYRRLDGRATIPAGATTTTVEIYPYDDLVDEGTQDVILQLRSTTSYAIGGTGTATMSITDNSTPQVYVKLITSAVAEPATGSVTAIAYQIIRPASGTAMTVNYSISGTATSGADFTALPGTIAFATGDTSKTINVSALADTAFEDAESVTLTLLPGTGYTLMTSQDPSATGFILDGDQPTIDVSAADATTTFTTQGTETSTSLRFIVTRKVSTASDLIVNYTMGGTATAGVDYTGTTGNVTILANTTSAYITIVPVNDTIAEGVESIVMDITPASGTYGLRTPSATMYLGDNDAFPSGTVAFSPTTSTVAENVATHNVTVNITGTPTGNVTVNYRVGSGTATGSGYDFTLADGLLTFPPGTTTLNIPITIHQDALPESAETIVLQLYNVSGGNLGSSSHTVTINNLSLPEAFTDIATSLLANSATLNGRVFANALATNVWFEYGPTAAYGSTTTLQAIGSGTASVSAPISGFAPGGYHFRLVAQNSAGTSYGINQIISANNADLANLTTTAGALTPVFSASTLSYSTTVPSGTASITVTPTVAQSNATVQVNGVSVTSGSPGTALPLVPGNNPITIRVTAQDGITTKSYTLNVTVPITPSPQTITFAALPNRTFGNAPFALTATASSGLPVSYSSSNTAVATIAGNTVTILSAGTTNITASQAGNANYSSATSVPQTLTVVPASQDITFAAVANKAFGNAPFALTATASSGFAVSYSSSNTAVATIAGNTVTILSAGTTTITATQAGNANYSAASSVPQTLTVVPASQTITFAALSNKTFGNAPFALSATASSGLAVVYSSSNTAVATIAGNTVTILNAGTTTITATQAGNANYSAASSVPQTLTIVPASQVIDFATLANRNYDDAPFALSATSSSGLAVNYASSNETVATIAGNTITIIGVGTTTITASQAGNTNYSAASSVPQTLTVVPASQVIDFATLANRNYDDAPFALSATASSGLAVNYTSSNEAVATIAGNTVTLVGVGTTIITASQAGDSNYTAATAVAQTLAVDPDSQAITFAALPNRNYGDTPFALTATSSSGLAVNYASSNEAVATIAGNTVTLVGVGSTIITASQTGDGNYTAATIVPQTLTVDPAAQVITFGALANRNYGDAPFALSATASSGLAASYSSSNEAVATIAGNTVTIIGVGSTIITASQTGDGNYTAATIVPQTLTVDPAAQVITFGALANRNYGDAPFALSATASSGLAASYSSSNEAVATIAGNTVTLVGVGSTIITASQAGDSNYTAATAVPQILTVDPAAQTITFAALANRNYGDAPFALSATASSGLAASYSSSNEAVATIAGNTVTIIGVGSTIITASQTGDGNYTAATIVPQTLTVDPAAQVITFGALANRNYGDAPFALSATASSGLAASYSSSNEAVATIAGNTVTLVGVGSTIITASQAGDSNYTAATAVPQILTVDPAAQTITFAALANRNYGDAPFALSATASSGLAASYSSSNEAVATIAGNTVTIVGVGSTIITASQAGDSNYTAATAVPQILTVDPAAQVIIFNALISRNENDVPFALTATASSNLPVSYMSSNPAVATISGSTVAIVGVGTTTIIASQDGDTNYAAAMSVPQMLEVLPDLNIPVIYEPFADTQSSLSGNTPGIGLTGNWISGGINVSAVGLTYGNLPTEGGMATKPSGSGSGNASVAIGPALNNAQLLNNGATLWFSFIHKRPATAGTNDLAVFAFGDASVNNAGITMGTGNYGFGVNLNRSERVQAAFWNNGTKTIAAPTTAMVAANTTKLIVGKIVWNANSAAADTLEIYLPGTNLSLPGTPHSITSSIFNQATFDTISFGGKNTESPTIDEIRFGATYSSVTGQTSAASNIATSPYETWSEVFGGSTIIGPADHDHDGDGVPNLIEYALGTLPNSSESTPAMLSEIADSRLRLSFTPQVVSGIEYTVQASSDLTNWVNTIIPQASLTADEPFTFVDTTDVSSANPPQRFLRLRVNIP